MSANKDQELGQEFRTSQEGPKDVPATEVEQVEGGMEGWTPEREKKLLRKIDLRLLPILGFMYSISLIDRLNLGLAMVAGMEEDLQLRVGSRYTILVMVFFVAYVIFEIPSNLVLPKAGAANWLSFLGFSFGATLIGMGFVKHWSAMAVCRAILGAAEAGYLPGCAYLITCWYKRYEVGKRLSFFYLLSCLATGFAPIFGYALSLMRGKGGLNGWRWIFIIEGAVTIVICGVAWFIIIDFPTKADNFLTPEEKTFVIARINADRGDGERDAMNWRVIVHHLKDWKLYFWSWNLMACTLPGYSYSYFLPIILRSGMGFSSTEAILLTAPPYMLSVIITPISGWLGDKYQIRGPIIAVHQLIGMSGMLITAYAKGNAARYFGSFMGLGFFMYCIPGTLAYQANNITSQSKRAVANATALMGSGIGGIIAGVAFKSSESPVYLTGLYTCVGVILTSVAMIVTMDIYFWKCNKAAKAGQRQNEGMANWYYTY